MDNYEILEIIGEGQCLSSTYGTVYKARHKQHSKLFAIKKFKESEEEEHVRKTAVRQIRMLRSLKHPNIVTLLQYFRKNKQLYLIFEYVDRTILNDLQRHPTGLSMDYIKQIMFQLVTATNICHQNNVIQIQVIHRDIKPENLLVSSTGVLKLCDFGFARSLTQSSGPLTDYVSTRWYRAPELLVGSTSYNQAIDVWSIGCILAQLLTGLPLFPGDSDLDTLQCIVNLLGNHLTESQLRSFREQSFHQKQCVNFKQLPVAQKSISLEQKFHDQPRACVRFLASCLKYDPNTRPTCDDLLKHQFFNQSFRKSFEVEMQFKVSVVEKKVVSRNSVSENNTPEPSHSLHKSISPKRVTMKSININPETKHLDHEKSGYWNFLPQLKRKEQESVQFVKRKRSQCKVGYLNHSHQRKKKHLIPSLKLIQAQNHQKPCNLSIIYQTNDSHRQLSIRGRHSRSNLKSRPVEHPYYHSVTPVPPSVKSSLTNRSKLAGFKSRHFLQSKKMNKANKSKQ